MERARRAVRSSAAAAAIVGRGTRSSTLSNGSSQPRSRTATAGAEYRVRSGRGTQLRRWATARLERYVVKGFTMDDVRLKNPPGPRVPDYFDELLARIRDIRSSEAGFLAQGARDVRRTMRRG